jgi:hypothetical protein
VVIGDGTIIAVFAIGFVVGIFFAFAFYIVRDGWNTPSPPTPRVPRPTCDPREVSRIPR